MVMLAANSPSRARIFLINYKFYLLLGRMNWKLCKKLTSSYISFRLFDAFLKAFKSTIFSFLYLMSAINQ